MAPIGRQRVSGLVVTVKITDKVSDDTPVRLIEHKSRFLTQWKHPVGAYRSGSIWPCYTIQDGRCTGITVAPAAVVTDTFCDDVTF